MPPRCPHAGTPVRPTPLMGRLVFPMWCLCSIRILGSQRATLVPAVTKGCYPWRLGVPSYSTHWMGRFTPPRHVTPGAWMYLGDWLARLRSLVRFCSSRTGLLSRFDSAELLAITMAAATESTRAPVVTGELLAQLQWELLRRLSRDPAGSGLSALQAALQDGETTERWNKFLSFCFFRGGGCGGWGV